MKIRAFAAAGVLTAMFAGGALAQEQPAISSAWGNTRLPQQECLQHGRSVFQRSGDYSRIDIIGQTVFADRGKYYQFGLRCIAEKQMFYIYGGGPGDADKELNALINELKAAFER